MEVAAAMSPAYATVSTHKSLPGLGKVGIPAIQFRSSFNPTRLIGSPLSDPGSTFLSHLQPSRIISAAAAAREDPPQPLLPDSKDAFVQSKRLISAAAGREDKSSIMDDEYERANEIEKANAALEMSLMSWTENKRKFNGLLRFYMEKALKVFGKSVRGEEVVHRGLWTLCENCKKMLYIKFLRQNKRICEECGYHMRMGSSERIELLLDQGTWRPLDEAMVAKDVLKFYDKDSYANRLSFYQKGSGLTDAIQTGIGRLKGTPVALGVMDFQFMGGSMGSVVGEKVTRLIEHATKESMPVIIVSSSGGARMQEGTLSLMQMAKISSALNVHQKEKKLLYIVILTNPTTGGVTASFGMLGDINIAEPKAYVAFAGKRVIEETSRNKISSSKGFQTAEAVFDAGLIDLIVPRNLMRGLLGEIIELYSAAPYKAKQAC